MVTLTAFADEISSDFFEQLRVLESEKIKHIEFRGAWGKNVLELSDKELDGIQEAMEGGGFRISAIGSPIGKIGITDDFARHLEQFERAIEVAKRFDTPFIRVFSFFIPTGDDPASYRNEVIRRMKTLVRRAEEADVILLHENEKEIYGDTANRCFDLFETCRSAHFRCAFDPANFVQCGVKPYSEAYPLLDNYIDYVHIKDALFSNGGVVPAGEGDGEVKQVLSSLRDKGYEGFLSLEPHLSAAGKFSGFSGPGLFRIASEALKKLLADIEVDRD